MEESLKRLYDELLKNGYENTLCLTLSCFAKSESLKEEKISVGLIITILKAAQNEGIALDVFDTTFFRNCNITVSNFFEKILFVPLNKRYPSSTPLNTFLANGEKELNAITRLLICDAFHEGLIKEDVWNLLSEIINNIPNTFVYNIFYAIINILTSENFAEGLITNEHLELIRNLNLNLETRFNRHISLEKQNVIENKNWISADRCKCIADVLTSENFRKGVIKLEDLKLLETGYSLNTYPEQFAEYHNKLPMILKSENYAKGLISYEWLVTYINLRESKYNFICGLDNIFLELIISENYGNGIITKEQIEEILEILKNKCTYTELDKKTAYEFIYGKLGVCNSNMYYSKEQTTRLGYKGFVDLLTSVLYQNKEFEYKDIEFLLDDEYEIFRLMIGILLNAEELQDWSFYYDMKEVKKYILQILNPENRNKLKEYISEGIFECSDEILSVSIARTTLLKIIDYSEKNYSSSQPNKKVKKI